ncbi:hypothetical protein [Natronolimnohabitans innermongolicus]|uniref:hypothetical protein n=1 Tax=Natronolimnohabitans innermongolicus TaxID=253107 RepID=UPI001375B755|nr:hypothetical protein [Natronolimnohabitans innermongolicus]
MTRFSGDDSRQPHSEATRSIGPVVTTMATVSPQFGRSGYSDAENGLEFARRSE